MIVSREHALDFLNRLFSSSSSVVAVLGTRFGRFCSECRIVDVTPNSFKLEQYPAGEILKTVDPSAVSLDAVIRFSYGDIREASHEDAVPLERTFGKILGALTFYFSETEALVIMECEVVISSRP
jgi:hypothetical protein